MLRSARDAYRHTINTLPWLHEAMSKLVCLGNPLLDLQADVDEAYLKKYDLKANDAILVEEKHMPIFDEVLAKPDVVIIAGGAAQNAARGAQNLLPAGSVFYFGSVGKDHYSEKLLEANKKAGVTSLYQYQDKVNTGKCAALLTGHNRSLVTDLAAANHFTVDHLEKPENWKVVESADFFYVGGFHLTVCPPAIQKLAKYAAANNKVFSLNLSAPFIPQFFLDPLEAALPYVDYLIGNESEALSYAQTKQLGTENIKHIAEYIAKLPKENKERPRVVIITQGTEPTVVVQYDPKTDAMSCKDVPIIALEESKIVDTNGAGDAFAGGFLAGIVKGEKLDNAVEQGHELARESIQLVGPSFPERK